MSEMRLAQMREIVAFVLAIAGMILALSMLNGCAAAPVADKTATLAEYERALEHCRVQGKTAGFYAVYEACAKSVDRRLCNERGLRCVGVSDAQ